MEISELIDMVNLPTLDIQALYIELDIKLDILIPIPIIIHILLLLVSFVLFIK